MPPQDGVERRVGVRASAWSSYKRVTTALRGHGISRRVPFLLPLNGAIVNWLRPDVTEADGHTFHLLPREKVIASALAFGGMYEPLHTHIARRSLRPGDVALDLGANIGYFTLLFAKLVGPMGAVYAFEPAPDTFDVLSQNVAENGYKNVTLVRKAVSNVAGLARLALVDGNPGLNHLAAGRVRTRTAEIETVRLDDHFARYEGRIDFIKMDVEGAESFALEGMRSLLDRHPRVKLLTEFIPAYVRNVGGDPEQYLRLLLDRGFDLFEVRHDIQRVIDPLSLLRPDTATNLYCVMPGELP